MKQLALIDSLIPDIAIFKESLNDHTDAIIFDYYKDSLDELRNKIGNGIYDKIGIVQEDNGSGRFFHHIDNETLVEFLKSQHQCDSLDLFMCNGYTLWKHEIDQLAETCDIEIGAATTLIGKDEWTLHNGVDLYQRYMNPISNHYPHVFMSQRPLSVSGLSIDDKVYDGTNSATILSYTLNGVSAGQYVTLIATFDDVNVGQNKSLTLDLSGRNYNDYYLQNTISYVYANITTKNLTITGVSALDREYNKHTNVTITGTPTLVGVISGDDVSAVFSSAGFSYYDVGLRNVYTRYTLSGTNSANYTVTNPVLSATITPKVLTIIHNTLVPQNKIYDGTAHVDVSGSADLSGTSTFDICVLSGYNTFASSNAGTQYVNIGLSGIHAYRYKLPEHAFSATIYQKEVIVSYKHFIKATTKYYDGTSSISITNWVINGVIRKDSDYVSLGASCTDAYVGTNKQIIYVLNDSTDNYYLTQPTDFVNGDLTVNILANEIYYDPSAVIATSKQYNQNNSVTVSTPVFRDKNNSVVTLVDCSFVGQLASANVGTQQVIFSLSGSGASNYILIATNSTPVYATVSAIELNVTGNNIYAVNKTYDGTTSVIVRGMSLSGVLAGDNVGVSSTYSSFSNANVGTWTVNPYFTLYGLTKDNYTVSQPTLSPITATITAASLTIGGAISVVEKTYDGNTDATITGAELYGLISGDNVTLSVTGTYESASIGIDKNVYLTFDVSGNGLGNYNYSPPTTNLYMGNIISTIPAPTNVVAIAGVQSASVSFTPPVNGEINYYIVTASTPGSEDAYTTGYSSPIAIDELKNTWFYKFTVRAYDIQGNAGKESDKSNGITTLSDSLTYESSTGRTYSVIGASTTLVTISIPSLYVTRSVAYIGGGAFTNCGNLLSLTIPSSVSSIGSNAFDGCSALSNVTVNVANPYLYVSNKTIYSINTTTLYKHYGYTDASFTIPNTVTTLVGGAFYGCYNIRQMILPENISAIGSKTFYNCSSLEFVVFTSELSTFTNPADTTVFQGTNVTTIYYLKTSSLNTTWSGTLFGKPTQNVADLLSFT